MELNLLLFQNSREILLFEFKLAINIWLLYYLLTMDSSQNKTGKKKNSLLFQAFNID